MKSHSAAELRQAFTQYFQEHGHTKVHSSSLVPVGDKSLLFTNAGMVPFKDVFLGFEQRDYRCAVSIQRCMRAGGKHNDLENVGYTARHHTFFEMMGNFSFGDYFKDKAISLAWQFITVNLAIPKEKLWVTIHHSDDESFDIWQQQIGVPAERIVRCGDEDNFWSMGEVGPCGPCSEIFYDHGEGVAGGPPGSADADGDRYIEIWNLVFMQYNRTVKGELLPLPKPSVDTGMGLERLAAVMQGVHNNYETNEMAVLVATAHKLAGNVAEAQQASLKVLADHIRCCAFLMTDGVVPSNEGRGYVLRRIIRRAIRHGNKLGIKQSPFFYRLLQPLCELMGQDYPELLQQQQKVEQLLKQEELRFSETLVKGLNVLNQKLQEQVTQTITGELAFHLYDTFGFPVDLTADIARERQLHIDLDGFERCMQQQQQRARERNPFKNRSIHFDLVNANNFVGYSTLQVTDTKVIKLFDEQSKVIEVMETGTKGFVQLQNCPFYADSGGQISDSGQLQSDNMTLQVQEVLKQGDTHLVFGEVIEGQLQTSQRVDAEVDQYRRAIECNHSATHLLHWALRQVLGNEVEQRGSLVSIDKLRFDFCYSDTIDDEQLARIQQLVNDKILLNENVSTQSMSLTAAKALGAMALFSEKYADVVRVVNIGDYSIELCGGTHVRQTGEIGQLVIVQETAVAAGIRRIEARTAMSALQLHRQNQQILTSLGQSLNADNNSILQRVETLQQQNKSLQQKLDSLQDKLQANRHTSVCIETAGSIHFMRVDLGEVDTKKVRQFMDQYKQKITSGVIFLFSHNNSKGQIACGVTADLCATFDARQLVNKVATIANGKGGGRADMATAGADMNKLQQAFNAVKKVLIA